MWSVWLVFCDCAFHSVGPLMDKDKRLVILKDKTLTINNTYGRIFIDLYEISLWLSFSFHIAIVSFVRKVLLLNRVYL